MGEFVECLEGKKEACEFLNYPVVSATSLFTMEQTKKIFILQSSSAVLV